MYVLTTEVDESVRTTLCTPLMLFRWLHRIQVCINGFRASACEYFIQKQHTVYRRMTTNADPVSVEFVLTIRTWPHYGHFANPLTGNCRSDFLVVLFTRAYAVWGGSRRVLLLLTFVFVVSMTTYISLWVWKVILGRNYVYILRRIPLRRGLQLCWYV